MPLKHFTETFLVVVLGVIILVTGLLTATLPDLPQGTLPWAVLFILSVIYPLSLHSLFQRRRADNLFRNLHWFPSAILLGWLLLQIVRIGSTFDSDFLSSYTWGWALGPVVLGFIILIAFCLKVIRRWIPRIAILAFILFVFAAAAIASEQGRHWESELASVIWSADFWDVGDGGLLAFLTPGTQEPVDEKNLDPSQYPDEESWRERLRMQKNREERISSRMRELELRQEGSSVSSAASVSSEGATFASSSSRPMRLPKSGFGWNLILLTMAGAYCGAVHSSARKRVER